MEPIKELAHRISRSRNDAAARLTDSQRLRTGYDLFNQWLSLVRSDVMADNPSADEAAVRREIDRRLRIARRRDATGRDGEPIYRDAPA
jgi:hypothetical protein